MADSGDDRIPAFCLESGEFPERLPFEAWREIIYPFFDTAPLVDERPFDVRYETYALDGVVVSERASGAFSVARSARHLRPGDTDHVILRAYGRGRVVMAIGDMPVVLAPGTISLTDLRLEMHGHTTESVHICCMIPRERINTRSFDRIPALLWSSGSPQGLLLGNALRTVWSELPGARAEDARALAAGLTGLINGLLSTHPDEEACAAINPATVRTMQAFIKRHLDDRSIDAATLCRIFACSRARLYRLFRPYGGVERYIRDQRLERCFHELSRAPATRGQVNRVATRWGFESPSHFHSIFKKRFGIAPSDVPPPQPDASQIAPERLPKSAEITRLHRWFRQL